MKHSIQILLKAAASLLVAIVAATASGCHYHNINGDLDGQWQLMSITEPDGTEKAVGNTYYAIQMHTVNLRPGGTTGNLTYSKGQKTMAIEFPLDAKLAHWGLPDSPTTVTFTIIELSNDNILMKLTHI
ncbi:MAG: lipocalin-like domain-containing protein, partial [Paramuribaculum sp.]|nr:lipocalin-like domain-containing protein [Paramuribaculum sp.]